MAPASFWGSNVSIPPVTFIFSGSNGARLPSLSFWNLRNLSPHSNCRNAGIFLTTLLFFIILLSLCTMSTEDVDKTEFTIVVDCGSTGTRLYVYSWIASNDFSLPKISDSGKSSLSERKGRAFQRKETEPGLDSFYGDPVKLRNSAIEPLLDWAKLQIPNGKRSTTPVFFLATAGMRKIPSEKSSWILNEVRKILKQSPFWFKDEWARIISGVDEAVYGWTSLNYASGLLDSSDLSLPSSTLGSLDLGGSSFEVTFVPNLDPPQEFSVNVSLQTKNFRLYAYSHPSFGMNDAFDRSVTHLLNSERNSVFPLNDSEPVIRHPCLHRGYNKTYTRTFSTLPTYLSKHNADEEVNKLQDSALGRIKTVRLVGKPNWDTCNSLSKSMASFDRNLCQTKPCALGIHQPKLKGAFVGVSGLFIVFRFFGLNEKGLRYPYLLEKGKKFCSRPWNEVRKDWMGERSLEHYCFRSSYVVHLLQAIGLNDDGLTVGLKDVGWTLGAALYEGNSIRLGTKQTKGLEFSHSTNDHAVSIGNDQITSGLKNFDLIWILIVGFVILVIFFALLLTFRWQKYKSLQVFKLPMFIHTRSILRSPSLNSLRIG